MVIMSNSQPRQSVCNSESKGFNEVLKLIALHLIKTATPLLSFAYELSEQLGEIDPYRVLALPAATLLGWQAHFELKTTPQTNNKSLETQTPASSSTIDEQCSAVMKMLR